MALHKRSRNDILKSHIMSELVLIEKDSDTIQQMVYDPATRQKYIVDIRFHDDVAAKAYARNCKMKTTRKPMIFYAQA